MLMIGHKKGISNQMPMSMFTNQSVCICFKIINCEQLRAKGGDITDVVDKNTTRKLHEKENLNVVKNIVKYEFKYRDFMLLCIPLQSTFFLLYNDT